MSRGLSTMRPTFTAAQPVRRCTHSCPSNLDFHLVSTDQYHSMLTEGMDTFNGQHQAAPNSPPGAFSYVPYQPPQQDPQIQILLQRIAGLENAVGQLQATCSQLAARDAALLHRLSGMVSMECASQMASLEEKIDEMGSDIAVVSGKRTAAPSRVRR